VAALERASHPALVTYIAHGLQRKERYVAMDCLIGCTLAKRLRRGALEITGLDCRTVVVMRRA
jgi:hypothetical protein